MSAYDFSNKNKELGEMLAELNETIVRQKQEHRQAVYDMLAEKRNKYLMQDDQYLQQLEKNVVYGAEGTLDLIRALETYLTGDFNRLRDADADTLAKFVQSIPLLEAKERARHHLDYLYARCQACPYHDRHEEYKELKESKETLSEDDYIEELEFNYIYHQLQNKLAKHYVLLFIQNDDQSARLINAPEDIEQIKMSLHFMTNFILDNIIYEE